MVRHRWDVFTASIALLRLHLGGSWPRVAITLVAGLRPVVDKLRSRVSSAGRRASVAARGG